MWNREEKSQWLSGTFEDSELALNKTQRAAHTQWCAQTRLETDCFQKMIVFRSALCEAQTRRLERPWVGFVYLPQAASFLLSLAPAIIQTPFSQARYQGGTSRCIFHPICSLVRECFRASYPLSEATLRWQTSLRSHDQTKLAVGLMRRWQRHLSGDSLCMRGEHS